MAPDLGIEVSAIFFDIKKAFNTMPHRPLFNKLSDMGLHPHILQWLGSCTFKIDCREWLLME